MNYIHFRTCCCNDRKYDDPYARGRASNILSVHTRPRYAKFNTKKLQLLQPSKLKMWWKMKQNLPISSSFKKDLPHLKCFIKIFPQKILPWKNESISCTNLLFLKKWIFSCFMSNLKEKKLETKQKKLSKVAKIISCYKKRHDVYDDFERKEEKSVISSQKKLFCT